MLPYLSNDEQHVCCNRQSWNIWMLCLMRTLHTSKSLLGYLLCMSLMQTWSLSDIDSWDHKFLLEWLLVQYEFPKVATFLATKQSAGTTELECTTLAFVLIQVVVRQLDTHHIFTRTVSLYIITVCSACIELTQAAGPGTLHNTCLTHSQLSKPVLEWLTEYKHTPRS